MQIRAAAFEQDSQGIWEIFHQVVQGGDTYAYAPDTPFAFFKTLWFSDDCHPYVAVDESVTDPATGRPKIVGTVVIKPAKPGLGDHVGNASYMVHPDFHGKGIGKALGNFSLPEAKKLRLETMQFNFVVSTNTVAVKL